MEVVWKWYGSGHFRKEDLSYNYDFKHQFLFGPRSNLGPGTFKTLSKTGFYTFESLRTRFFLT